MKYYTKNHIWLEQDERTGRLNVGVTMQGNEALDNGITMVEAFDGKLSVESTKQVFELELPVRGELRECSIAFPPDAWTEDLFVTSYEPGYDLDTSQCMDEEAYRKYVE
jgi:hypothetical protein